MKKFHHVSSKSFTIIRNAVRKEDKTKIVKCLSRRHPADIADIYEDLSSRDRMKLLSLHQDIITPIVFKYLDAFYKNELIRYFGIDYFKNAFKDWSEDELVELIEILDPKEQVQLIDSIGDTHKLAINIFMKYPEGSVGRSMSLDFILIPNFWTVKKTIEYLKANDAGESCSEVFIANESLNPIGVVAIASLISAEKTEVVSEIANFDIMTINANSDQEKAYTLFSKYKFICMPVVENSGRMVGILRPDAIVKIVEETVTEDYLNLNGVYEDETNKSLWWSCFMRLRWLSVSFLNALFSPMIIHLFQDTIQKAINLATLMPIVGSIGGNIGIQTISVVMKAFSAKQLRERRFFTFVLKEASIGSLNGLIVGVFLCIFATLFFKDFPLGCILGASMFFCATWAAFIGATLPILCDRLGYDSSLSSGPLVTTITDVSGFFIFLSISKCFLN